MPKFHTLRVRDVRRETSECVSIAFEVPADLRTEYEFIQGQYLTLRTTLGGQDVRRSYSICSSPAEGELRVAVKHVAGGLFSTFINEQVHVGDALDVMTPLGRFYPETDARQAKHYVAFAAGSGITPVMSILKAVLSLEPRSRFTLFYGNRGVDTIIFREELEGLKNRYMERLSIHHVLSRESLDSELFSGRIDRERCRRFCDLLLDTAEVDEFFLCGPFPMIEDVRAVLGECGIDKKHIHVELFTPAGGWEERPARKVEGGPKGEAMVTVTLDGNTFSFPMNTSGGSILEAAQRTGADVPFACKGGVCSTCRAKLEKGEVEMAVNYALEEDELEAGYILTCQAFPKSKAVRVNYDV